jgi:hypothetical protein
MTAKHIAWFRFNEGLADDRIESHLAAVRSPQTLCLRFSRSSAEPATRRIAPAASRTASS